MGNDYENEPYVGPEQEKLWNTLNELSSNYYESVDARRQEALMVLLDESKSSDAKKRELTKYLSFRMNPDSFSVQLSDGCSYSFPQIASIATSLLNDRYFPYGDSPQIINNLDPFFESVTLEDVVLAYHNYRLSMDDEKDESLSHLVKLVGLYAKYAFEMDELRINFPVQEGILAHDESISHFCSVVTFMDSYLRKYGTKWRLFANKYVLKDDEHIDFASRIDRDAAYSFGKRNPLDIRQIKLIDYLRKFDDLDDNVVDFGFEWIINDLYKPSGWNRDVDKSELSSIQWPTFCDLMALLKKECEQKSRRDYFRKVYEHIIEILTTIRNSNLETEFDKQLVITEEDYADAEKNNAEVDLESAFDNIQRNIRYLFVVVMAADAIPEFSADEEKMKWREMICRKLCEIFSSDYAYEDITKEDGINQNKLRKNENRADREKASLYKTFLMEYESASIESIMQNRLKLLDRAKAIDPEDFTFLDKCSASILKRIQDSTNSESLVPFAKKLREDINSGKTIQVPESVINTLATAELMYTKYAIDEFAVQGFDYSSISALYYQAFENAYNELIWGKYANYLNSLYIDSDKYTDILQRQHRTNQRPDPQYNRGLLRQNDPGYGFLPSEEKDWKFFITYDSNAGVSVKSTCMYASFAEFIKNDRKYHMSKIPNFYQWFAIELGFGSKPEMLANNSFISLLNRFRTNVSAAVPNRNNASHGGSEISKDQCAEDRETVLADLQRIRAVNIGLIQQLIAILNFNH